MVGSRIVKNALLKLLASLWLPDSSARSPFAGGVY
jgi:hypothetical protein